MDLCTKADIISDAMKYVTQKTEQIDTLHKIDERIESMGSSDRRRNCNNKQGFLINRLD
jgi:hypothetical protein